MKSTRELFEMVQSMTAKEKKYVRTYLKSNSRDSQSNSLTLFSVLEKLKEFDTSKFEKSIAKNETLVRYTSAESRYLRNALLKALRNYRDKSSARFLLSNLLEEDRILYERMLYRSRQKHLTQLERLAEKYDYHEKSVEITDRHIAMLIEQDAPAEAIYKKIDRLKIEQKKLFTYLKLKALYHDAFVLYRLRANSDSELVQQRVKKIHKKKIVRSEPPASFQARDIWLGLHYILARLSGNLTKAFQFRMQQVELWEDNPHQIKESPTNYKVALSNFLVSAYGIANFEPFKKTLAKMDQLPITSPNEEAEIFQNKAYLELLWLINTNSEEVFHLIPKIESGLATYDTKVNGARKLSFLINIAIFLFCSQHYENSLTWLERVIAEQTNHREDIKFTAHILTLVCHYELDNLELLASLTRNVRRQFNRKNRLYNYQSMLLSSISKIINSSDSTRNNAIADFKERLMQLSSKPDSSQYACCEELLIWCEVRLNK